MATSDGIEGCALQRGRSQSDPNILSETSIDHTRSTDVMDQQRALHSGCLVTGVRTPPIRRNSKLASLGRIFKPWKWRKKKNEKLKQSSTALERKAAARQSRDELVRRGLAEMMESDSALACGGSTEDPGTPTQDYSDGEEREEEPLAPLVNLSTMEDLGSDEDNPSTVRDSTEDNETVGEHSPNEEEEEEEEAPSADTSASALVGTAENPDGSGKDGGSPGHGDSSTPPPPGLPAKLLTRLGSLEGSHTDIGKTSQPSLHRSSTLPRQAPRGPDSQGSLTLRGQITNPTGSPHLGILHPQLPPSCIIEELHRALATKHRQDSFHAKEIRSSPKRRSDGRLSRTSSLEKEPMGQAESKKDSDENKENLRLDQYYSDASGLLHDQDSWNESVISGTLPRRMRKELLAVKLRNRPSKQELEDRNIFPVRSDQERQEIRQQIEMKLAKRLSQRPAVEELESRNILKQRNDQSEQEERREIKQRLNRKLNQRPTVDELRDRKILIRFSDYVEVAKAQDYDRRADKPWTRLSAADKAAIRKELNEFKSNEMEVHASSKHLTRFHRP
ncbi:phosphatase and actin regulator 3b isoform X2 [Megalops cyprinoides]|uniref:phosphatase and actin regulator 3b isoform X2 n=1 Tax=Megalops cyprinoides TaxID=118141 RepID=UPI001864514B|nr:phosphatase and actin regulator 3b isoform X2 [Megalops cyprinoides]